MKGAAPSVFINCPFDPAYRPRFWSLVFAILDTGLTPRSALDLEDGAAGRLDRIIRVIGECDYSIHDLCRSDEPRFNMPFETGLAVGLARYRPNRAHKVLVLATSRKNFDRTCSDLRGIDPHIYKTYPHKAATAWLQSAFDPKIYVPSPDQTARRFAKFWRELPAFAAQSNIEFDYLDATWRQMLGAVHSYLEKHPPLRDGAKW